MIAPLIERQCGEQDWGLELQCLALGGGRVGHALDRVEPPDETDDVLNP